ncbi:homeobox protein DBX2 isoform X2 [Zalophus californianus]|uniref:Homeobox protein DBX2 isoform X2 n=1 Tax=Zalophus californianus TaxID=9704 RepID=A0A6J2D6K1_ZALCA|nr:homeobox protein DBX2 isoform X2 [Zalophus californianus]
MPSPPSRVQHAPVLREAATGGGGADLVRGAELAAGAQAARWRRTMLPSAVAAHAGAYWDVVASSALLNFPTAPGFGNLGKSFLIENLLRAGGAPPHGLQPPAHHGPASTLVAAAAAAATAAGVQVRPLPASPVPLKLCPAAEQVSPGGAPYGTRWAFQVLSPSADGARLPGRAAADRDCTFQPSAPASSKPFFLSAPPFYSACCGGSCRRPASPTAFASENLVSEQKNEVAEFQREGSAFQQVCPGSRPSRGSPLKVCSGAPFPVFFTLGSLPAALESQMEGEFARTFRKTHPTEFRGSGPRSKVTAGCLVFVFGRCWRQGCTYWGSLSGSLPLR